MPNPIALAIPFFFLLMGVELFVARRRGLTLYRFNDAVVDLACGITQQVFVVFEIGLLVAGYVWLYQYRLFTFAEGSVWPWVIAFFAVDFVYYWWHRLSHEVNFLWAVHVVHHQSEDYNLAVALRQAVLSPWTIWPFHLVLALVGIPPITLFVIDSASTLYQFWIHTELVGKLGWFERLFNTPAQHRVHHAINPQYLDKNYAATLSIWDRLFGTFEEETEKPVYGITTPLASFDPFWAQAHYFVELWQMAKSARRPMDKLLVWVKGPAWKPGGAASLPPQDLTARRKYYPSLTSRQTAWVAVNLVAVIAAATSLLWFQDSLRPLARVLLAASILLTMLGWGALLEKRRWVLPLEVGRFAVAGAAAAVLFLQP